MLIDIVGNTDICPYPLIQKGGPSFEMVKVLREFQCFFCLQYPHLFAQCPLRLKSGMLLYGPPGTGKTLVVNVASQECNLHLITVKVSTI